MAATNSNITKSNSGATCSQCKKSYHWNCDGTSNQLINDFTSGVSIWKCYQCYTRKSRSASESSSMVDETCNDALSIRRIKNVVSEMQLVLNQNMKEITKVLNDYGSRIRDIDDDSNTLRFDMNGLDIRIDNLEQASYMNSLEIQGVPLQEPDDPARIVCNIGTLISCTTSPDDWSNIHRQYRKPKQDKIPSIIVFFKETSKRDDFLAASKSHSGILMSKLGLNDNDQDDKFIYINEHLTNPRKKLFYAAKVFKKENGFKYLWTKNGRIYLKKDDDSQTVNVNFYTNLNRLNESN